MPVKINCQKCNCNVAIIENPSKIKKGSKLYGMCKTCNDKQESFSITQQLKI